MELNTNDQADLMKWAEMSAESLHRLTVLLAGIEESLANIGQFMSDIHDHITTEPKDVVVENDPCEEKVTVKGIDYDCVLPIGHSGFVHESSDGTPWRKQPV